MTTLIIARHGNTFNDGETPRRIGGRTDMPLTEKGREQARVIGTWLKQNGFDTDAAFCSRLSRTKETAQIAMREAGCSIAPQALAMFDEIDYGPDENKTEDEAIARIGATAIKQWDESGVVPPGWRADPIAIIENWISFGKKIVQGYPKKTIFAVTSNGIARFAPHMTGDFDSFKTRHKIKISTGRICVLEHDGKVWNTTKWNIDPKER
ncbi:MAG: histidine phosphatase family protein [Proteobacteria bacterium]|nr:histidine phosphatase family protein [Pseudomonadota bacterium]